jgi:uncharacterized protein (AIM24 family)
VPVPVSAGTGKPDINTEKVQANSAISSTGAVTDAGVKSGPFQNLGAEIVSLGGYDTLKFKMAPASSVITNQETMSYMDGGLTTSATLGSGGIFGSFFRGITGASVLQNAVSNPTTNTLKMTLSPLIQGSIVQIDIAAGETWRFADKCFMACTPNMNVSGNINIFSNFRMMFIGENLTYTTVSANQGTAGTVWIQAFGGIEKHELEMGTGSTVPLFINNGCFLGMMDNNGAINFWNDYVSVGTANGMFSAMFTQLGWVMKIQDTTPPKRPGPVKCVVITQSLNPHNFEKYIAKIAERVVRANREGDTAKMMSSGMGAGASSAVLGTAAVGTAAVGTAAAAAAAEGTGPALAATPSITNSSGTTAVPGESATTNTSSSSSWGSSSYETPANSGSSNTSSYETPAEEATPSSNNKNKSGGGHRSTRRKAVKSRGASRRRV